MISRLSDALRTEITSDRALQITPARRASPSPPAPHWASPPPLGRPGRPALHYPLGDGTGPQTWTALRGLTQHLRAGS
ncbi:DUF6177 family protein [Streptomyces sp. bgisy100]|uniref:DUF6177 family protein n=1 Tax=Streptomyces sp. bgisy100 TaxID=3413783 RepID=UPI003D74EB79